MIDEIADEYNVPSDLLASVINTGDDIEAIARAAKRLRECLLKTDMQHVAALALYYTVADHAPIVKRAASWLHRLATLLR